MVYEIIPIYTWVICHPLCTLNNQGVVSLLTWVSVNLRAVFFPRTAAAAKTWAAWHLQARRWPEAWPSLSNERPPVGAGTELVEKKGAQMVV